MGIRFIKFPTNLYIVCNNAYKCIYFTNVVENSANRHFVRMNVVTKGAVIETEDGLAKVTNRPSRTGIVNAILLKK
ncbi:MAG: hypothetical protein J4472_01505 [DPANN group archaeon]|nr:hypothetical protein [DPANN group archaeon]